MVWPASVLLGWYLLKNANIVRDKVVLELGSGCGLAGFVASFFRFDSIRCNNAVVHNEQNFFQVKVQY